MVYNYWLNIDVLYVFNKIGDAKTDATICRKI